MTLFNGSAPEALVPVTTGEKLVMFDYALFFLDKDLILQEV